VVEPRDDHGDDGDDQKMIKCFTFGKQKKRKNKARWKSRQSIARVLVLVIKTP
jgi:hypothetical protein